MSTVMNEHSASLPAALAALGAEWSGGEPGHGLVDLPRWGLAAVPAVWDGPRGVLEIGLAPCPSAGGLRLAWVEEQLRRNAILPSGAKLLLRAGEEHVFLRLGGPRFGRGDDGQSPGGLLGDLDCALARLKQAEVAPAVAQPVDPDHAAALGKRLAACGFPAVVHRDNRILVQLDVPPEFVQANVEPLSDGVRLAVELADAVALEPAPRLAVGLLLLTTCGAVELARAVLSPAGKPGWEVLLEGEPGDDELSEALAALSVACRLSVREARLLTGCRAAGCYLMIRGWRL